MTRTGRVGAQPWAWAVPAKMEGSRAGRVRLARRLNMGILPVMIRFVSQKAAGPRRVKLKGALVRAAPKPLAHALL